MGADVFAEKEPELLISGEAASALDVSMQVQVLQLLDEIRDRMNLAILFTTHDNDTWLHKLPFAFKIT